MEWIIKIVGLACIGVLFVSAEPAIKLKHFLFNKIENYQDRWFWRLINCSLCSGFWIGLVFTGDILTAATVAVLGEVLYQKINGSI
jgi:hypothetical protein